MRKDQRGITFIELMIAIAIASIIMIAATIFLGSAHKNYNHASAQIDLQSESQILMEQIGMWVMEGNRITKLEPADSGVTGIAIYKIPRKISVANPHGAAEAGTATKRVIWISASGTKLYTKTMSVADVERDTTVISASDEVQQNLIGEYVTTFSGEIDASTEASVTISIGMEYLQQDYAIKNVFKLRNMLR